MSLFYSLLACGGKSICSNIIKDEEIRLIRAPGHGEKTSDPSMTAGECTPLNGENVLFQRIAPIMAAPNI